METLTISSESQKPQTGPISNIKPGIAELLANASPEDLVKMRALADFFIKKPAHAPIEMEFIYASLTERLDTIALTFPAFSRHYLYNKMLKNLEEIRPFLDKFAVGNAPHQQYRFWRLAAQLLESNLKGENKPVNLITMVSFLYRVPELFNKAFPAINSPLVKKQILNSRG